MGFFPLPLNDQKGQPNGVATLDENAKVPNVQIPPVQLTFDNEIKSFIVTG